ncbi:hypothetical protein TNCV_1040441 [Trichonephila clavipes]|nr:hypothetical protein TNCV_1040441 [Trichonephila clavipes]
MSSCRSFEMGRIISMMEAWWSASSPDKLGTMYFHASRKDDIPSANEQNMENTSRIGLPYCIIEEFVAVDDNSVYTTPIMAKALWSLFKAPKVSLMLILTTTPAPRHPK